MPLDFIENNFAPIINIKIGNTKRNINVLVVGNVLYKTRFWAVIRIGTIGFNNIILRIDSGNISNS